MTMARDILAAFGAWCLISFLAAGILAAIRWRHERGAGRDW